MFFFTDAHKASANSVSIELQKPDSPTPPGGGQVSINVDGKSCQSPVGGHLCEKRTGRSGQWMFVHGAVSLYVAEDAAMKNEKQREIIKKYSAGCQNYEPWVAF